MPKLNTLYHQWDINILKRLEMFHPEPVPQLVFVGSTHRWRHNPWQLLGDHKLSFNTMGYSPAKKRLINSGLIKTKKQTNRVTGQKNAIHLIITTSGLKAIKKDISL